jgi:beta-glucuronidase
VTVARCPRRRRQAPPTISLARRRQAPPTISLARRRQAAPTISFLLALVFALLLLPSAIARAQTTAPAATPPTYGALYQDGQTGRYLLGGTWLYQADPNDVGVAQGWEDATSTDGWSPVTVPNSYNAGEWTQASMDGWVGWYRRDFTLPSNAFASWLPSADRHWIIRFESVNYRATVWLNGHEIGTHTGAFLPFELDLVGLRPGVNTLVVRVDNQRTPADMPPGPGGLWFNYGGITREVYLRAVQAADMSQVIVRPLLSCAIPGSGSGMGQRSRCPATIDEQVTVRNVTGRRQTVVLHGQYGGARLSFGRATIASHATWTAQASVRIDHPRLWWLDDPYLYKATLTLTDAHGRKLQGYFTWSGVRSVKVTSDGRLELNGHLLHLRGVNLHEQTVAGGAALGPSDYAQLMSWVQELGAKIIRAHYPVGPEMEEMADRDGILIWSEVPVYQMQSKYLAEPSVIAHAHSILEQNILDNENHPSILLWSIGNELPTPATGPEVSYIKGAAAIAHRLDPTRPVGMAVNAYPGSPCESFAYAPLDVIGWNDYFGWFSAGGGGDDDRDYLSAYMDKLRACYPKKAMLVTEFGFDANMDGPVEVRGTYAFQSNSAAFHLGVFATKSWLSGALYFPLQDFANSPNYTGGNPWPDPPWDQKGLIDQYGNLKPAFGVVQQIYQSTQQVLP